MAVALGLHVYYNTLSVTRMNLRSWFLVRELYFKVLEYTEIVVTDIEGHSNVWVYVKYFGKAFSSPKNREVGGALMMSPLARKSWRWSRWLKRWRSAQRVFDLRQQQKRKQWVVKIGRELSYRSPPLVFDWVHTYMSYIPKNQTTCYMS